MRQLGAWLRRPRNWAWVATVLPGLLVLGIFLHYYHDFVSDDAFISFRYAEHLATGRGLEWNPGYRVEGYSNFLWVALLATLRVLGMAVPDAARLLSWLAGLATMVLVVVVSRAGRRERPALELLALAPLPVALAFPYQYWTALRLETALYALLLLLAPFLFVREETGSKQRPWGSALAYLALALVRPEGAIFSLVPGIYLLVRGRSRERFRQVLRQRWLWLAILAGGILVYNAWRWIYFGDPLPNTYYAKASGPRVLVHGWEYLVRFCYERPYGAVLLAAALLLGAPATRTAGVILATLALQAAVVVLEGGDWMREFRLLVPVLPLAAAALGFALQRFVGERGLIVRIGAVPGVVLLCLGVQGTMGTPRAEWERAWSGAVRNTLINLEGEMTEASRKAGRWLKRHARPTDLVAVNHAGALPYYSDLPTLDMAGLNDRHIARTEGPRHGKWDARYVMSRKPDFVVLNTRTKPVGLRYVPGYWAGETALTEQPDFARYYRPLHRVWMWRHRTLDIRGYPSHAENYIMIFRRDPDYYRPVGSCLDFESGTFAGWEEQGKAFGGRPARGARGYQRVRGFEGRFLANSYPGYDAAKGLLRSRPFEVRGDYMMLLVAGASDAAKAGVRLMVAGRAVRVATGQNDGQLRPVIWNLVGLVGRQAVIEIYDNGPGPWGHVLADSLCQFVRKGRQKGNRPLEVIPAERPVLKKLRAPPGWHGG